MQLYVLVEGSTEYQFIDKVVAPHLQRHGLEVKPIIVTTSREPGTGAKRRGGGDWSAWLADLRSLSHDSRPDVRITTLFDLYGLPRDFPELAEHGSLQDTARRSQCLEEAMARAFPDRRLIPYLQRHEVEALLFTDLDRLGELLDSTDREAIGSLKRQTERYHSPEDIDDDPQSHPSARLSKAVQTYQKTVHGPITLEAIGLTAIRSRCPRFDAWVTKLENLDQARP
jgi:hypothetical protein